MRVLKNRNSFIALLLLGMLPLFVMGQRKELRAAERAIDQDEFYIAKKHLEKAEPLLKGMNESFQARFYQAKGMVFLALNGDNYGSLEGLQKSRQYFKKVIELGKKADGEYGLEAIKETLLDNALLDREDEDYENAYGKFYKLSVLYPKDTLYLFAAATNAFQAEDRDEKAIQLFEELREMGFEGKVMQYSAKNALTGQRQVFSNKKERDAFLKSGGFKDAKEEVAPSQKGKILRFLAELYVRNEEREKAMALLQDVQDDPADIDLYRDLTFIHNSLGNKSQYREHLITLLEEDEQNKAIYALLLGEEMEKEENAEKAKQYYELAAKTAPENSETQLTMARFLLKKEEKIRETIKRLEGDDKDEAGRLAALQEEQKEILGEALPYLEKSFALEPNNAGLIRALYQTSWLLQDRKRIKKYGRLLKKEGEEKNNNNEKSN